MKNLNDISLGGDAFELISQSQVHGKRVSLHQLVGSVAPTFWLCVGDTRLMCTVVLNPSVSDRHEVLTVNYKEEYYAVGRVPPGQSRRENISHHELLTARFIDRSIRPLIVSRDTVHVTITVLSIDKNISSKEWAVWLAGTSIARAGVKIYGPVAVYETEEKSSYKFRATLSPNGLTSVEFSGKPTPLETLHSICEKAWPSVSESIELASSIANFYKQPKLNQEEVLSILTGVGDLPDHLKFDMSLANLVRNAGKLQTARADGRKSCEIRNILHRVGVLPNSSGSAIFTRGTTMVLASAVVSSNDKDTMTEELVTRPPKRRKFYTQYTFPPACTGQSGKGQRESRREIGHGRLILNALKYLVNDQYIRLVARVLSADGSTSMASVCAGSLALYAAKAIDVIVAGISVGLIRGDQLIVDLTAQEDEISAMDCKIAGTETGVTAIAMDTKSSGISVNVLRDAIQAGMSSVKEIIAKIKPEDRPIEQTNVNLVEN